MRCYSNAATLKERGCFEHDAEGFHHARSMLEIQAALRAGRKVYDPDGDLIEKAAIMPKEDRKDPYAMGRFTLTKYGSNYKYHIIQMMVEDEPIDDKALEEEVMKSLMASLTRG